VPGAASLDKDWDSDKLHFDPEALMEATPVTEPMRRPRASPLAINAAALGAILLRDIKLRAGPYYTGFLMILLMPLVHLLIVVMAFHIFGRLVPQGTETSGVCRWRPSMPMLQACNRARNGRFEPWVAGLPMRFRFYATAMMPLRKSRA
jgi:hypothetical protein